MAAADKSTIVIKRVKKAGGGHHGGARTHQQGIPRHVPQPLEGGRHLGLVHAQARGRA